jgi:hypothetical protein
MAKDWFQFLDDGAFDAADVGDNGAGLEESAHQRSQRAHLGKGRAKNDQIGALDGLREIGGDEVGQSELAAFVQAGLAPDGGVNARGELPLFDGEGD